MFEVYRPRAKGNNKMDDQSSIKISKQSIVLDKKSREMLQAENIELAYDQESKTIRLRKAEDLSGLSIKKTKIFAKGFVDAFGIQNKGKYPGKYDPAEKALFVTLP